MYQELILNFVLALVAVAVLSLFILGNITIVVLVCVTVVSWVTLCPPQKVNHDSPPLPAHFVLVSCRYFSMA